MRQPSLTFALAQLNPTVGDLAGNLEQIRAALAKAAEQSCHILVLPELALTGYPPQDLLLRGDFIRDCAEALDSLTRKTGDIAVFIGHPLAEDGHLFNAASVLHQGRVIGQYRKRQLPNYAVFDERRYFTPGEQPGLVELFDQRIGIAICEDLWQKQPLNELAEAGAQLTVAINASPFHEQQQRERAELLSQAARGANMPLVYVNQVGGQDELVFDGCSLALSANGEIALRMPSFETGLARLNFADGDWQTETPPAAALEGPALLYTALITGVRDYVLKNGFEGIVLGLSGGVDSALCLMLAADALGPARVAALLMPSRHTRAMSLEDAAAQAERLGIRYRVISIEPMYEAALHSLEALLDGAPKGLTCENLQSRIRALLLMAASNQWGYMVLNTGNKSEIAVGYSTLYGDSIGGFAALKDVPKTRVYELAKWRNRDGQPIPERVLTRAPSAELAPDQADTDSLPPYSVLDPLLQAFVDQDRSADELVDMGFDPALVERVIRMVAHNEYKRQQAPPGVRISARAFGRDRRYPVTQGFFRQAATPSARDGNPPADEN